MNQLFYLDSLEIEEPVGFSDIELSIKRDETFHGITYEASTSSLQFWGAAAAYLKNKKETEGVKANVEFRALSTCENYDYEEMISGRLNFGKYKESCGTDCFVSLPLEQQSCAIILHSRKDQKIDLDKETGVDDITLLGYYNGLGIETELPAHNLFVATEGYVAEEGDVIDLSIILASGTENFVIRPTYTDEINASINQSQLVPSVYVASDNGFNDAIISPVLLLDDDIKCFDSEFDYEVILKGSYNFVTFFPIGSIKLIVAYGEYPGSLTILHEQSLPFSVNFANGTFNYSYSGTLVLPQSQGFYVYLEVRGGVVTFTSPAFVTFDKETYVNIEGIKSCPATNAELYLIHESLSRISEAVTNGCVRVKSSYYGRTDSQPFFFESDGCGGLRSVTSGLKIRRAEEDKFFVSMKDLLEGLNAIDNIGFDIISDPDIPGNSLLRIESVDYFYQDKEILRHDGIPKADTETEETKHYSRIDVGYKNGR